MRSKTTYQELFTYHPESSVKVVREYVKKYKEADGLLRANPRILDMVHADLSRLLSKSRKGRDGDYTSDQILRSIIVQFIEQWSYRRTVVNLDHRFSHDTQEESRSNE